MMWTETPEHSDEFREAYMPYLSAIKNWQANIVKLQAEQPALALIVHPLRC
jgi:hypothetical protein